MNYYQTKTLSCRRVARIWKRGGAILKEWEVCKRRWLEFSLALNQFADGLSEIWDEMSRKDRKFKGFFRPELGDLQKKKKKKKKKKKVFAKIKSDFSAEIRNSYVFSAQNLVISKKNNGLRQNSRRFFSQFRNFKRLRGGYFRMGGGAIFHFSQKIGLKTTKNMRFCILHKPNGGGSSPPAPPPPPPPPGYATAVLLPAKTLLVLYHTIVHLYLLYGQRWERYFLKVLRYQYLLKKVGRWLPVLFLKSTALSVLRVRHFLMISI